MYIQFTIDVDGCIECKTVSGKTIPIGCAETYEDSKLIKLVHYEDNVPEGLDKLVEHAILKKCIPSTKFEFNVHFVHLSKNRGDHIDANDVISSGGSHSTDSWSPFGPNPISGGYYRTSAPDTGDRRRLTKADISLSEMPGNTFDGEPILRATESLFKGGAVE